MTRGGKTGKAKTRKAGPLEGSKTHRTKRGIAPTDTRVKRLSVSALSKDLKEAREQQAATAEILKVIASSPSDVRPVFGAIVESAKHLLGGFSAAVFRFIGDIAYLGAITATNPAADEIMKNSFPRPVADFQSFAVAQGGSIVQISDTEALSNDIRDIARARGFRSMLIAPLMNRGTPIGMISVTRVQIGTFSDHHEQLLQTFADQAVIAIENTRLFNEVQARANDLREALTYQTGSGNILKVIASSPTDVKPVLNAIVQNACELCEAYDAILVLKEGEELTVGAHHGRVPLNRTRWKNDRGTISGRAVADCMSVHVEDLSNLTSEFPIAAEMSVRDGGRTVLGIPLIRDGSSIGAIVLRRIEVHPFDTKQIALLQNFADQAVIAIQNARLFNETKEALEHQTATSEVLQVISGSMADAQPVFERILDSIERLFDFKTIAIFLTPGDSLLHLAARRGIGVELLDALYPMPMEQTAGHHVIRERRQMYYRGVINDENVPISLRQVAEAMGNFSGVITPMFWQAQSVGTIAVTREPNAAFSAKELNLLQTFAGQAVVAIQNARLFNEVQAKTRDLTEALIYQTGTSNILSVIASSPTDVAPVLQAIVKSACELCGAYDALVRLKVGDELQPSAHYGPIPASRKNWHINRNWTGGRAVIDRKPVHVHDVLSPEGNEYPETQEIARQQGYRTSLSVPLLREGESIGAIVLRRIEVHPFSDKQIALLQTFADQAVIAIENVRMFEQVQQRTNELSQSLEDLRTAQDRLVQTEKLASLGQLTAGIAHEIKNPLNFVNNFSALSAELTDELNDVLKPIVMDGKVREDIDELTGMLKSNLEKVVQHGKRADSIVKNMLLHSREGSGEQRSANINALLDESLNLAYHGARAEKPEFNITLRRDLDPDAGAIDVFPQEITRAFINLISNGFYAASKRKAENGEVGFEPELSAATKNLGNQVEIRIRDNGTGIPEDVKEKIFNPFFTTKPAGEGTGLGLSMCHDIVVKQHGGRIEVDTQPGQFTEFTIVLPRTTSPANTRKR